MYGNSSHGEYCGYSQYLLRYVYIIISLYLYNILLLSTLSFGLLFLYPFNIDQKCKAGSVKL